MLVTIFGFSVVNGEWGGLLCATMRCVYQMIIIHGTVFRQNRVTDLEVAHHDQSQSVGASRDKSTGVEPAVVPVLDDLSIP